MKGTCSGSSPDYHYVYVEYSTDKVNWTQIISGIGPSFNLSTPLDLTEPIYVRFGSHTNLPSSVTHTVQITDFRFE